MARKRKNNEENDNQIELFSGDEINNQSNPDKKIVKKVNQGELLEYQVKRLFFFMGYYARNNIIIQTNAEEPCDVVTDLDVYGIYIHSDFSQKTIWGDCKSGVAQEINRVAWLNGIKDMIDVDDILFVKKGTKLSTKLFANAKGIQIVDLGIISKMEKRFGIKEDDWRGSWNPLIQNECINTFKNISIPDNSKYKRVYKFISTHYWAIEDNFTKCKKTITALRDLASVVALPLAQEEHMAIRWAVYQLSCMLLLPLLQICRQVQCFPDKDKNEIIVLGLIYGSNSKAKIDDILKVTNGIARKTLLRYFDDVSVLTDLPEIKLHQPEYTEAFIDMISRIIEQPLNYFDILRFLDFVLFQYDLKSEKYDIKEISKLFTNTKELLKSTKTFLHFVCYISGIPKDIFIALNEKKDE